MTTAAKRQTAGDILRHWRRQRRLSQLELALDAETSARHLSFVETGRASASREMLLRLAEHLDMPLRERNILLLAAGYAPAFRERTLDSPDMAAAKYAFDRILKGHEPFPAIAIDRHWTLLAANDAVPPLLDGVSAALLEPPVNILRLSLHPEGLASRIENFAEWRAHLLERLRQQIDRSGDPVLMQLLAELCTYPGPTSSASGSADGIIIPLKLRRVGREVLSLISTTTVFGTPTEVTLSELALECFYPADEASRSALLEQHGR